MRLRAHDFYRMRHHRWIELFGALALWVPFTVYMANGAFPLRASVVLGWAVVTAILWFKIAYAWWPLSRKREQRVRQRLQSAYPNECVRCGFNIQNLPDQDCPGCGEPLRQGRLGQAVATRADGGAARRARMRMLDFHRFRRWYPLVVVCSIFHALVLPVTFLILCAVGGVSPRPAPILVTAWGVVAACCALGIILPQLPLSEKLEQRQRAWLMRPNECVRCGYDIRYCAGPNCPECGEPLGKNQGRQAQATLEAPTD